MSSLTAEQVTELTERINARFAEFNVGEMRVFEPVTPGVARLAFDVVEEWTAQAAAGKYLAYEQAIEGEDAEYDAEARWNEGWKAGRESMRAELGILERMGGWVGPRNIDPGIEMNTDWQLKPLAESHPDVPLHINGDVGNFRLTNGNGHHADPEQIRADIKDLGAAYPSLEDEPNGKDIFEGVHPVAGAPEDKGETWLEEYFSEPATEVAPAPPLLAPVPEPTVIPIAPMVAESAPPKSVKKLTEPSPAAVATLGPEHTVVTPLIPRRSALPDIDAGALSGTRMSKDERAADLRATIHALQDMAVDGMMPSMQEWKLNRPEGMLTAQGIMGRHNKTWAELAEYAKLKLKASWGKSAGR